MKNILEYSTILEMELDGESIKSGLHIVFENNFYKKINPNEYLHKDELIEFDKISSDIVKHNFCAGRYSAKKSISLITGEQDLKEMIIEHGVFGFPIVKNSENLQVSIAHTDSSAVAICFNEKSPMGIDIEIIKEKQIDVIETQLTQYEKELSKDLDISTNIFFHQLWTSKEALGKAIKTGFTIPMLLFEVNSIEDNKQFMLLFFKHFEQFKAVSLKINENYILSIVLPKSIDINNLFSINQNY